MNIVIVCSHHSRGNGGLSSLIDLSQAATRAGARVSTLVTNQCGVRYFEAKIKKVICDFESELYYAPFPMRRPDNSAIRSSHELKRIIQLAAASPIDKFYESKARRRIERADVIIISGLPTSSDLSYLRGANPSARLVFNHPGSPRAFLDYWLKDGTGMRGSPERDLYRETYCRLLAPFEAILFQSPVQAAELGHLFPQYSGKTRVIRPGVDEDSLAKIMKNGEHLGRPGTRRTCRLVSVGSVQSRKNQLDAIRIVAALTADYPQVTLDIVGGVVSESYQRELERTCSKLGVIPNVIFHGHRKDYASLIARADILVHTALAEGVPRVLREAMYLEVPIVASDISGINDLLEQNISGKLCAPGNIEEFTSVIASLIDSGEVSKNLARGAKSRFLSLHSKHVLTEQVKAQILSL